GHRGAHVPRGGHAGRDPPDDAGGAAPQRVPRASAPWPITFASRRPRSAAGLPEGSDVTRAAGPRRRDQMDVCGIRLGQPPPCVLRTAFGLWGLLGSRPRRGGSVDVLSWAFVVGLLAATLRLATPLLFATMGELLS